MNSIRVPFLQDLDLNIPAIKVILPDNIEVLALVDSGADTTVFNTKDLPEEILQNAETKKGSYVGMNGEVTPNLINKLSVACQLEGVCLPVGGITGDLGYLNASMEKYNITGLKLGMLLGSNTLNQYNAKIDYENKVVDFYYD